MEQSLAMKTPRDIVESRLLERFSHRLFPLDEEHIPDVGRDKEGSYGFRYFSLSPYANGPNIVSMSTNFPRGLIYQDEGAMFGVGVFYRDQKKMTPTIHIIAPRGENWTRAVNEFSGKVLRLFPEAEIVVRHLLSDHYAI